MGVTLSNLSRSYLLIGSCLSGVLVCIQGCGEKTECEPFHHQQCDLDGNVRWYDSCGLEMLVAEECPPANAECLNTSSTEAECRCVNHWMGEDCSECPGNWDPEADCAVCAGNWDSDSDCAVCLYGWDPANDCSTCVASHVGPSCDEVCIRYVHIDAGKGGNGLSWGRAFRSVQDGIYSAYDALLDNPAFGACEVWVGQGTYYVYQSSSADSIHLLPRVWVYGGFHGGETRREQRDFVAYETILDGRDASGTKNVASVTLGINDAVLDGFTITGAKWGTRGGGMYNLFADFTVANCLFVENDSEWGGAMFNEGSSPTIINTVFAYNIARTSGAVMYNRDNWPTLINCVFYKNHATYGAVMYNQRSFPVLRNCTSYANTASTGGCMYSISHSEPFIRNTISWGDSTPVFRNSESSVDISFSDVQGGVGGNWNLDEDPLFVDAENGDLHLTADSPCIDKGNDAEGPPTDIEGQERVDMPGDLQWGLTDIGAYEFHP